MRGAQGRPHEILDEFLAEILYVAFVGTRGDRFGAYAFELLALANVGGDANDAGVVPLLEPRNDDRCVEPTGVGEGDGSNHGRLNKYSELLYI